MTNAAPAPVPAAVPGKTLGIVAVIVSIFFSLIGIILGFVARSQSKAAGYKNGPATAAIVIGFIALALQLIFFVVLPLAGIGALTAQCAELGTGVHEVNGVTVTCG
jgi:uncharacterized membrane protein